MAYNYDILFKYIVIGDVSTGKSSLIHQFATNNFHQQYQPTIAAEFFHKLITINQMDIKIMIWDTAGQETFKSMVRSFYRNCIVAIVVYDATNLQTFNNLKSWLSEIDQHCHKYVRVVLVANKSDLTKDILVPHFEGQRFAKEKGYDFYAASAVSKQNVEQIFVQPALKLVKDLQQRKLTLLPDIDMGIRFSNRRQTPTQKKLVEVNIKGSQPSKCSC